MNEDIFIKAKVLLETINDKENDLRQLKKIGEIKGSLIHLTIADGTSFYQCDITFPSVKKLIAEIIESNKKTIENLKQQFKDL